MLLHFLKKTAIKIIDVNGKWVDQTNQEEADEIISTLISIYSNDSNASVGVIVFSKRQANLIRKTLRESNKPGIKNVLQSFDSIEPDTLFIKSIDEVQGEERDIIIFGITYGDHVHNYMLLSGTYAENKINVAITRAKKQIIIIKSHKAKDYRRINSSLNSQSGSKMLFDFLEYAENVTSNAGKNIKLEPGTQMEKDFLNYLKSKKIDIYRTVEIRNKKFYISKQEDKYNIHYLIDLDDMKDARNNIWFFKALFKSRGYNPKPVLITELYKING